MLKLVLRARAQGQGYCLGLALALRVKVDFHCRVIFTCVRTQTLTGFTCVNKIETMCEKPRLNVKVEPHSTFTFTSDLPYIVSILFTHVKPVKVYVRTHVNITRQWKSTFQGQRFRLGQDTLGLAQCYLGQGKQSRLRKSIARIDTLLKSKSSAQRERKREREREVKRFANRLRQ